MAEAAASTTTIPATGGAAPSNPGNVAAANPPAASAAVTPPAATTGGGDQVPEANRLAMYERLLEKSTRDNQTMTQRLQEFEAASRPAAKPISEIVKTANPNASEPEIKALTEAFNSVIEQSIEPRLQELDDRKLSSDFENFASSRKLDDSTRQKFQRVLSNKEIAGLMNQNFIGFDDLYRIMDYERLVNEINTLKAGKGADDAAKGISGAGTGSAPIGDIDFEKNPDAAKNFAAVREFQKRKGLA